MKTRIIIASVTLVAIIALAVVVVRSQNRDTAQSTPSGENTASSDRLPSASGDVATNPAVTAFVDAISAKSVNAVVNAFSADATVIDVTRTFEGHDAIRQWATNELVGGSLQVLEVSDYQGGQELLVEYTPEGAAGGFQAEYRFDISDNKISKLDMQYPD